MALKPRSEDRTLGDFHDGSGENMDLVSSTDLDSNPIMLYENRRQVDVGLNAPSCSTAKPRQVTQLGMDFSFCPSTVQRNFDDPMAFFVKPPSGMDAVYREDRRPFPTWSKKCIKTVNKISKVVHPPPIFPKARTGVSQAALNYKATDRIERLAKHRPVPKKDTLDERLCFSVKPKSLTYKPSLRIQQLAMPRTRSEVKK